MRATPWLLRALRQLPHARCRSLSTNGAVKGASVLLSSADITNTPFTHSIPSRQIVALLDEPIMFAISMEQCPVSLLEEALAKDKHCSLAHLVIVFQFLRRGKFSHSRCKSSLAALAQLKHADLLNERELLMFSAAEAWTLGGYSAAGRLLEQVLWTYPTDLVSIRLAQDAFFAGGDSTSAMRATLSSAYAFNDSHILYGYYMGQVCRVFAEEGRYVEAEEFGTRAMEKCKGQDFCSMQSLMNTYLALGRSSECTGLLDYHSEKFEESNALVECTYAKARALILKGNYTGAMRKFDDLLLLFDEQAADPELLALPTTLLWLVNLNSDSIDLTDRWITLAKLWIATLDEQKGLLSPSHLLFLSMAYAGASEYKYTGTVSASEAPPDATGSSFLDSVKSSFAWTTKPATPLIEVVTAVAPVAVSETASPNADLGKYRRHFHETIRSLSGVDVDTAKASSAWLNKQRIPEAPSDCSERSWLLRSAVLPVALAMRKFLIGEYDAAFSELKATRIVWSRIGGSAISRDVIEQTMIEACMRAGRMMESRRLLSERTSLIPNDSQSWRRLAGLLAELGNEEEAKDAKYTAWQLGIGQGGFGGPR